MFDKVFRQGFDRKQVAYSSFVPFKLALPEHAHTLSPTLQRCRVHLTNTRSCALGIRCLCTVDPHHLQTERLVQELAKYAIDVHNIVINQVGWRYEGRGGVLQLCWHWSI